MFAAANFWVYTAMQVPVGVLIDRDGTRLVVCAGGAVTPLGTVVLGVAPGYGVALLGPMLVGLGTSGIFVGLMEFNVTWFPAHRYGLVTGITMFVGDLGSILAEGPSPGLLSVLSWRSIFLIAATAVAWSTSARSSPPGSSSPSSARCWTCSRGIPHTRSGTYRAALGIPLVLAVVGFVFSLRVRETLGPRGGIREADTIA